MSNERGQVVVHLFRHRKDGVRSFSKVVRFFASDIVMCSLAELAGCLSKGTEVVVWAPGAPLLEREATWRFVAPGPRAIRY